MEERVFVVMPASGTGNRFGTNQAKQFQPILGRPLISYAVETFQRLRVDAIIVLVEKTMIDSAKPALGCNENFKEAAGIFLSKGGETRHQTIKNALFKLCELEANPKDIVVVQDGVRVLCSESQFQAVVAMTRLHGVCGIAQSLISTVIQKGKEGAVAKCLRRDEFAASEMPQGFTFEIFQRMYQSITSEELDSGTECLDLARKHCGIQPVTVPAESPLWKVTFPRDLDSLDLEIKRRNFDLAVGISNEQDFEKDLRSIFTYWENCSPEFLSELKLRLYQTLFIAVSGRQLQTISEELMKKLNADHWLGLVIVFLLPSPCARCLVFEPQYQYYWDLVRAAKLLGSFVAVASRRMEDRQIDHYFLVEAISDLITHRSLSLSGQLLFV